MSEGDVRKLFAQIGVPVTEADVDAVMPLYSMVVRDVEELERLISDADGIPLTYDVNQK